MKRLILIIQILLLASCNSTSPNNIATPRAVEIIKWSKQLGASTLANAGAGNEYCLDVAKDGQGNFYCSGYTEGELGEVHGGGWDGIIVKFSSAGQIVWIKQFGGVTLANPSGDNTGNESFASIAIDSADNIIVSGFADSSMVEPSGGGADVIVIKMDLNGSIVWSKQFGASTTVPGGNTAGIDTCNSIITDSLNNIYCAGNTSSDFAELFGGGLMDAFMMKLDSAGNLVWATQFGLSTTGSGNNSSDDKCNSIAFDSAGNVYCTGQTYSSMGEANGGGGDFFVTKLDSSGAFQWLKQFGAITKGAIGGDNSQNDSGTQILVTPQDELIVVGLTGGSMGEANGGGRDAFITKLSTSGALTWFTQLGAITKAAGGSNAGSDLLGSCGIDPEGNFILAGHTDGSMAEANAGGFDNVFVKISSNGALKQVHQLGAVTHTSGGNNSGADLLNTSIVDSQGNVFAFGYTDGNHFEPKAGLHDIIAIKIHLP